MSSKPSDRQRAGRAEDQDGAGRGGGGGERRGGARRARRQRRARAPATE